MSASRLVALRHPRVRGLSLIESLCAVGILAISLGLALPDLEEWRQRQALQAASAELETDLQYARSQAVALNRTLRLTVRHGDAGTCYAVHASEAPACDCAASAPAAACGTADLLRLVRFPANGHVQLTNDALSIAFTPQHGTVTPTATFRLESAAGVRVHQVVNVMGRTRTCVAAGDLPGLKAC